MDNTFIHGSIPTQIAQMSSLVFLDLANTSLSGYLPTEIGRMSLTNLTLHYTRLSGTLPAQLTQLTELESLILTATHISGTIPMESLGKLRVLEAADNRAFTGVIPTTIAQLTSLVHLDVSNTSLSGTIPPELGELPNLLSLDLYEMRLSGRLPKVVLSRCEPFGKDLTCTGLPPLSCAAFGPNARLSLTSMGECIQCLPTWWSITKIVCTFLLLLLAFCFYLRAVKRGLNNPQLLEWIATLSLLLFHLQMFGLLSSPLTSISSEIPNPWLDILHFVPVVFADLGAIAPQCLLPQQARVRTRDEVQGHDYITDAAYSQFTDFLSSPSFVGSVAALAIPALATFILWASTVAFSRAQAREVAPAEARLLPSSREDQWAHYGNWKVMIFGLQLPTACRVGLNTLILGALQVAHRESGGNLTWPIVYLVIAVLILAFEVSVFAWLACRICALQGLLGTHEEADATPHEGAVATQPYQYLTDRYKLEAPYWQLVLWTRQVSIVACSTLIPFIDSRQIPVELSVSLASLAVLIVSLMLHCINPPYRERHQNTAELLFTSISILVMAVSCFITWRYGHISPPTFGADIVALLAPLPVYVIWLRSGGIRKSAERYINSLHARLPTHGDFGVTPRFMDLWGALLRLTGGVAAANATAEGAATAAAEASGAAAAANATAEGAATVAAEAMAAAEKAEERSGVRDDISEDVQRATVRIGIINHPSGELICIGSGTIVDGGEGAPTNQVLTCAHVFLDTNPWHEYRQTLPASASEGSVLAFTTPGVPHLAVAPQLYRFEVPPSLASKSPGHQFTIEGPNDFYMLPHWCKPGNGEHPADIANWADSSAPAIAIGIFRADGQPTEWKYWAELATPHEVLKLMRPGPTADQAGMHANELLDVAVLHIRGELIIGGDGPRFRGPRALYPVSSRLPASTDLAGLPRGRPLGDAAALRDQIDTITTFGYPSPRNEVHMLKDSGTLQAKVHNWLVARVVIHDGSSGGGVFDHLGRVVGINSNSTEPKSQLPPDYVAYLRMVVTGQTLLEGHGLTLNAWP